MSVVPLVRDARPEDLPGIVRVFLDCWRISYAAALPAELVARVTDESAHDLWTRALASDASHTIVATAADAHIAGVASYRLTPGEDDPYDGYVASLYVDPATQGTGIGRLLLSTAEAGLRDAGATSASLWVFADNAPSVRFYARQGWSPDGESVTLSEWGQPQVRLAKNLT
ncbi:N-acetyltransferase family protein [Mumia sp. DW29H23]|uniref:GNAT family N-acetyltransferase n=1 Tax=Mumia sp. DW29H23 TaxID=3421241 RepID=UPI003D68FEEB